MTNLDISNAYVGDTQVSKLYLGDELVWPTVPPEPVYSAMPLTFEIISGGTITYTHNVTTKAKPIYYRINEGDWTLIKNFYTGTTSINVEEGDIVEFKGNNDTYAASTGIYDTFSGSTATFNAYGNIMSLVYGDAITGGTSLSAYAFYDLFANTRITSAENLILPAQTLGSYTYGGLFEGCINLTTGPELPANRLYGTSYGFMFMGCRNLTYIKCTMQTAVEQQSWVQGVGATGTFVKHPDASWPTGRDGIPEGWTVTNA